MQTCTKCTHTEHSSHKISYAFWGSRLECNCWQWLKLSLNPCPFQKHKTPHYIIIGRRQELYFYHPQLWFVEISNTPTYVTGPSWPPFSNGLFCSKLFCSSQIRYPFGLTNCLDRPINTTISSPNLLLAGLYVLKSNLIRIVSRGWRGIQRTIQTRAN